jgi:hypothetical protein
MAAAQRIWWAACCWSWVVDGLLLDMVLAGDRRQGVA